MVRVYSDIIQFQGNHYDFGYMQGELLNQSPILAHRKKTMGVKSITSLSMSMNLIMSFGNLYPGYGMKFKA